MGGSATELRHVIHAYQAAAGADLVHDHTLVGPVYADRFPDLPVVTTNHGPFQSELGDYYRAIGDRTPIIAISHHQASTAAGTPIAAVIHHGVDVERFPSGPGDGGYALFLGRMCPEKGVDAAVRVARRAGMPLRIAAKMSEAAEQLYFDRHVRPLLGGDIEYVGEVGGADKLELARRTPPACSTRSPGPSRLAWSWWRPWPAAPRWSPPRWGRCPKSSTTASRVLSVPARTLWLRPCWLSSGIDRGRCRKAVAERFSATRMVADHLALYDSLIYGDAIPLVA